jgi:pimeloyl-ACP methyl ester carboxylesterase
MVDARHIGAAGMSLGGLAVYGLVSNTCCRDRRITAAELLAAVRRDFPDEKYVTNRAPVLLVQGDADPGYHNSVDAYRDLAPTKWFITLGGSEHSPPFEVPPGPEAPLVYRMTTDFWDRYLKNDTAAAARIVAAVQANGGTVTLRRDVDDPER